MTAQAFPLPRKSRTSSRSRNPRKLDLAGGSQLVGGDASTFFRGSSGWKKRGRDHHAPLRKPIIARNSSFARGRDNIPPKDMGFVQGEMDNHWHWRLGACCRAWRLGAPPEKGLKQIPERFSFFGNTCRLISETSAPFVRGSGGTDLSEHSALKSLPLEQTKSIFDLVVQKGALNEMD